MISYSQTYLWKKILYMCRKKMLVYYGPYELRILKKTTVKKPFDGEEQVNIFYVETDDRKFHGMLEVTNNEYKKGEVGQYYGRGGVIRYIKKEDCYFISRYDIESIAIRKIVNWARIRMFLAATLIFIFIYLLLSTIMEICLLLFV